MEYISQKLQFAAYGQCVLTFHYKVINKSKGAASRLDFRRCRPQFMECQGPLRILNQQRPPEIPAPRPPPPLFLFI